MELKRHQKRLSPKQTEELVGAVVELIVSFLKKRKDRTEGTRKDG